MTDFGTELRRLMNARGLGVREIARQVPCSPGYVANFGSGNKKPSATTARRLDVLLSAGGALTGLAVRPAARQAGATAWADDAAQADTAMRARLAAFSGAEAEELVLHLSDQWHALVKADNLLGPRHALEGVSRHLIVIDALLRTARGPVRE